MTARERPMLFSGPMVRAILAGKKTQTRRVVKNSPARVLWNPIVLCGHGGLVDEHGRPVRCQYGQPGDRLWVRETWAVPHRFDHLGPSNIPPGGARVHYAATEERGGLLWRPSIHMCRWASRITLEITGVRVELLQDISAADTQAEGVTPLPGGEMWTAGGVYDGPMHAPRPQWAYRRLWESINGPGSWAANPWVWVVEFRRVCEAA